MKWTVAQLRKFHNELVQIDETIDLSEQLKQRDPEIRGATPIHVTGTMKVDFDKATVHLHIRGTLVLPCSRTLVDTNYPFDVQSTEIFLLEENLYELDEEFEIHQPENGVVDLNPIIEELILVEIPMQVFSNDASMDQHMKSGKDWSVITEEEYLLEKESEKDKIDPRLAGLASLLKNEEDE